MAEGESKKTTIELSVGFIIFLVVLIICAMIIYRQNGTIKKLEIERDEWKKQYETSMDNGNNLRTNINALVSEIGSNKGGLSIDQIISKINDLLAEEGLEINEDLTEIKEIGKVSGDSGDKL